MPARKPTAILVAEKKTHLSSAEEEAHRAAEIQIDTSKRAEPPEWLPKKFHEEFKTIGEILISAGLFTDLDRDTLAQYFISRENWLKSDKKAQRAVKNGDAAAAASWTRVQNAYFNQARKCADSMGLSISSRCRMTVPDALKADGEDEDASESDFAAMLKGRRMAALGE